MIVISFDVVFIMSLSPRRQLSNGRRFVRFGSVDGDTAYDLVDFVGNFFFDGGLLEGF